MVSPLRSSQCFLRGIVLAVIVASQAVHGQNAPAGPGVPGGAALPGAAVATPARGEPAPAASGPEQFRAADQAWEKVKTLARSAGETTVTPLKGVVAANREEATKIKRQAEERAQKFRAAAQNARDFHAQHSAHPQAAEARRVEALAALQGITPKDKAYERSALATAAAFRANAGNPPADRFQVAHAMESREISKRTLGRPWFSQPVLAEQALDRLHLEFGERPEVWAGYLALAESANCDAGRDVAYRIVQSLHAPEPTRASARRILTRYQLVRKPLDFPLTPVQGRATTLAQLAGKTTVVCLWDGARAPEGPPGLHDFPRNPSPNTRWIYVSLGQPGVLLKGRKPLAAPAGTTCVEPLGWASPLVARLQLAQLPYVFVLGEKQQLSGYGRIDEIPALLAGLGRPVLP